MVGCNRGVVGDTIIKMWDLSEKPISEIKAGDEFLAYDESNAERLNEKPRTTNEHGDFDINGTVDPNWLPGSGFDSSHTGYNAHRKGIVKEIQKHIDLKLEIVEDEDRDKRDYYVDYSKQNKFFKINLSTFNFFNKFITSNNISTSTFSF